MQTTTPKHTKKRHASKSHTRRARAWPLSVSGGAERNLRCMRGGMTNPARETSTAPTSETSQCCTATHTTSTALMRTVKSSKSI